MSRTTAKYQAYLKTSKWAVKRMCVLSRAHYKCEACGRKVNLEIHHKTYDRIFDEPIEDLLALCKECHKRADRQRGEDAHYEAALATYASKKYGSESYGPESKWIEDEFDRWLEKQERKNY